MYKVQPGHMLVRHFGIDAYHVGLVEGCDESQHRARGRQVDVPARFVGLGFEGKLEVIALINDVFAQEIKRFTELL